MLQSVYADTLVVAHKQQQYQNEEKQAADMPELASHTHTLNLRNVASGFLYSYKLNQINTLEEKETALVEGEMWWDSGNQSSQQHFLHPLRNSVCCCVCVRAI